MAKKPADPYKGGDTFIYERNTTDEWSQTRVVAVSTGWYIVHAWALEQGNALCSAMVPDSFHSIDPDVFARDHEVSVK